MRELDDNRPEMRPRGAFLRILPGGCSALARARVAQGRPARHLKAIVKPTIQCRAGLPCGRGWPPWAKRHPARGGRKTFAFREPPLTIEASDVAPNRTSRRRGVEDTMAEPLSIDGLLEAWERERNEGGRPSPDEFLLRHGGLPPGPAAEFRARPPRPRIRGARPAPRGGRLDSGTGRGRTPGASARPCWPRRASASIGCTPGGGWARSTSPPTSDWTARSR